MARKLHVLDHHNAVGRLSVAHETLLRLQEDS